ncbi:hypothetical protein PHYPSEUDO_009601 [Phytophthora pseudosyringae]|uniref:Uncharacterized protein n=1 Tax=Phytophthora pseudosyringae TaxID=221518 RepID=A0A8T1WHQ4_9STRA|nr:hypothetical protein PHYPSEUDO_009601 [Phytophthora pseudosyringae]
MMVWGGLFLSPMMHTWYNLMEKVFVGTGKLVAAKKVVADMVFVALQMPICFYTSTGLMAGRRPTRSRSNRHPLPALPFLPSLTKRASSEDQASNQQSKDRSNIPHTQSSWRHG